MMIELMLNNLASPKVKKGFPPPIMKKKMKAKLTT
jgi:hypothetical protein